MKKTISLYTLLFILFIIICLMIPSFISAAPSEQSSDKTVYLTFDDGPTPHITDELLDILKTYNIKATFFVVGKEIEGREAILKRIYAEGHSIGLHTYSHNFKKIYQSPEGFIEEMEQTKAVINEVLGTDLDFPIIRFPGGSSNRLNTAFYQKLTEKGYLIFDWNVDLKDGIKGHLPPDAFIANAKKCMDRSNRRIILAHCNANNTNTCKALPGIISFYKEQGYTFKAITKETPPYFYRFKK